MSSSDQCANGVVAQQAYVNPSLVGGDLAELARLLSPTPGENTISDFVLKCGRVMQQFVGLTKIVAKGMCSCAMDRPLAAVQLVDIEHGE